MSSRAQVSETMQTILTSRAKALERVVWRQLERGLPARQFSILVCLASNGTKAQDVLELLNGLPEVAHTKLNPACFAHFLLAFHFQMKLTRRLLLEKPYDDITIQDLLDRTNIGLNQEPQAAFGNASKNVLREDLH